MIDLPLANQQLIFLKKFIIILIQNKKLKGETVWLCQTAEQIMARRKGIIGKTLGSMARTATRKRNNAATQAVYIAMWGEKPPRKKNRV
jgi:hypothetical protein